MAPTATVWFAGWLVIVGGTAEANTKLTASAQVLEGPGWAVMVTL